MFNCMAKQNRWLDVYIQGVTSLAPAKLCPNNSVNNFTYNCSVISLSACIVICPLNDILFEYL